MFSPVIRHSTLLAALATVIVLLSCAGSPGKVGEPKPVPVENPVAEVEPPILEPAAVVQAPEIMPFDPATVTEEVKSATIVDVRAFIDSLNLIIRRQDYEAWLSNLTDDYIRYYSDEAILSQFSEYPIMKQKGVKLKTLRDYFTNVVYPSRQNDKVDDIEFVGEYLIKAITVSPKGNRNILYLLEKHGDAWKIGIGR